MKVVFQRRLLDRVLRLWTDMARGQGFPYLDQIEPSMLGVDWMNCLVIAVQSPVQASYFAAVGKTYHLWTLPTRVWLACSCHICRKCFRNAVAL